MTDAGDVLAKLIDGLRLLWVLCSPFNEDERMEDLLQRVAWQLCTKVADILSMDTLFKYFGSLAFWLTKALAFKQGGRRKCKAPVNRGDQIAQVLERVVLSDETRHRKGRAHGQMGV